MTFPIRTTYAIERSTNGRDWTRDSRHDSTSKEAILRLYVAEAKASPRDWLRIVKCEETLVCEHLGDGLHGRE